MLKISNNVASIQDLQALYKLLGRMETFKIINYPTLPLWPSFIAISLHNLAMVKELSAYYRPVPRVSSCRRARKIAYISLKC